MVDELLNQKSGSDINNINLTTGLDEHLDYIRRDDSISRMSDSTSDASLNSLVRNSFKNLSSKDSNYFSFVE